MPHTCASWGLGGYGIFLTIHELKHAYQYQVGQVSFNYKTGSLGLLGDITDETAVYNRLEILGKAKDYNAKTDVWTDQRVVEFGDSKGLDYNQLQNGPIDINSPQGIELRKKTIQAGQSGTQVGEVYIGWQKDYEKGKKSKK